MKKKNRQTKKENNQKKLRTLTHYLIDLAILLAAHKFFMLVRKLNLNADLVWAPLHKGNLIDHHHSRLHSVVGSVDGEDQVFKAYIGTRICTDVREHCPDIRWRRSPHAALRGIRHKDPPRRTVKLTSLPNGPLISKRAKRYVEISYQRHDLPYSPLHVQNLGSLNANQTSLAS